MVVEPRLLHLHLVVELLDGFVSRLELYVRVFQEFLPHHIILLGNILEILLHFEDLGLVLPMTVLLIGLHLLIEPRHLQLLGLDDPLLVF